MDEEEVVTVIGCVGLVVLWGIGDILAVVISWEANHSVLWAMVHGLAGWFYIAYHFLL